MKNKKYIISPLENAGFDKNDIPELTPETTDRFKNSKAFHKYVLPIQKNDKEYKRIKRKEWWKNNLIPLLGLLFAFISALPVILEAVEYILSKIM